MGNFDAAVANSMLDAFARNVSYANAAVWVKLHTGDPGGDGSANASAETDRKQATFGSGAASGTISNTAAIEWTAWDVGAETISWVSLWTASTAGTFLGNDQLSANAVMANGDTFRIPIGDLDLSIATVI
jgi:hypothetical protein